MKVTIPLRLEEAMVIEFGAMAKELGISRNRLIIESVGRNLVFVRNTELPTIQEIRRRSFL